MEAPRNTPTEIINRLNRETNAILSDPKIKDRLVEFGGSVLLAPRGLHEARGDEVVESRRALRDQADVIFFSPRRSAAADVTNHCAANMERLHHLASEPEKYGKIIRAGIIVPLQKEQATSHSLSMCMGEVSTAAELAGRKRATLEVKDSLSIGFGVVLTPGLYLGWSGRYWLGAQHFVELTAQEVTSLGGVPPASAEFLLFDVTSLVRGGKIDVF